MTEDRLDECRRVAASWGGSWPYAAELLVWTVTEVDRLRALTADMNDRAEALVQQRTAAEAEAARWKSAFESEQLRSLQAEHSRNYFQKETARLEAAGREPTPEF